MSFNRNKFLAFDVETSGILPEYGLQPHRVATGSAWLTSYATAEYWGGSLNYPVVESPSKEHLKDLLQSLKNKIYVCWNAPFDIAWLIALGLGQEVMACNWLDAMLLKKHLEVTPEYDTTREKKRQWGLKEAVAETWPQYAGYGEGIDFQSDDPEMVRRRLTYNQMDAVFTLKLAERYWNTLEASDPRRLRAALIEAKCLPLVASTLVHGLPVDGEALRLLDHSLEAKAADSLRRLEMYGADKSILASPAKLKELLFSQWGLPVVKQTEKGADSTDKEVLHELALIDPRAKLVRAYREAVGNRKKFVTAIQQSALYNGDGHTRPQPRVFGTYTGRMTYSSKQGKGVKAKPIGFALHQMKRGAEFRNAIAAPEGYSLVEFDAAAQEFRWMAIASGDETMLQLCQPGEDPHSYMGAAIVDRDYHELIAQAKAGDKTAEHDRKLGKFTNLASQYRTSAKTLRVRARVDYDLALELDGPGGTRDIHATYQRTYRGVPEYWERQIRQCCELGYAETFAGRRVQLQGDWGGRGAWPLESTAINFPIQGTGGDQKYLALAVLLPYIVKHGIFFAYELHDGIFFFVPDAILETAVPEMQRMLNNLPYKAAWGFVPPIPLPWDAKSGKRWGELKEMK